MKDYQTILYQKFISKEGVKHEDIYERYAHSLSVALTSVKLVNHYNYSDYIEKAFIAGILHDYAKFIDEKEYHMFVKKEKLDKSYLQRPLKVLHGELGALVVKKELQIDDQEIIDAIRYHVVGRPNMNFLEKVIYIADFIEPMRLFEEASLARELAYIDLDQAVAFISKTIIESLQKRCLSIDEASYLTYEYYNKKMKGHLNDK